MLAGHIPVHKGMLELPKKCGCICADGVLPEAALMDIGLPQMIRLWMPPICQTAFLMGLDYMMRHAHKYDGCPQKSTTTEDLSDISEPRYDLNVSNLSFCKYGLTRHLCPHMHHDWQRICVSKVGGRGRGRYTSSGYTIQWGRYTRYVRDPLTQISRPLLPQAPTLLLL